MITIVWEPSLLDIIYMRVKDISQDEIEADSSNNRRTSAAMVLFKESGSTAQAWMRFVSWMPAVPAAELTS
jgi:hypothetical protein